MIFYVPLFKTIRSLKSQLFFPDLQKNSILEIIQLAKCPDDIIKRGIYLNLLTDGGPGTLLVGDDGLLQHRVQHNPLHRSDSRPLLPKHLRAL